MKLVAAAVGVALVTGALAWRGIDGSGHIEKGPIAADAVLVLSGDVDYLRVKHGAQLVTSGRAGALLLTGKGIGGDSALEMRAQAINAGVDAQVIFVETESTSTRENILFSIPAVRRQGWRRIALVTSDSHLTRALAAAHRAMPDIEWIGAPVPDAGPPERARRLRIEESVKLLWYKVRGWA